MRKFYLMLIAVFTIAITLSSCSCKEKQEPKNETSNASLVVENVVSTDREGMFISYGSNYRWFETGVLLKNYLDTDECDGTVEEIDNIFQVMNETEDGTDVSVITYITTPDTCFVVPIKGFWVEDNPLNEENVKITFKEAFEKVMEVNLPKPHSRHVVLRKEVGPCSANPQWIFGNNSGQIYIDAVTGEASGKNPVFPEDVELGFPLGEWP